MKQIGKKNFKMIPILYLAGDMMALAFLFSNELPLEDMDEFKPMFPQTEAPPPPPEGNIPSLLLK